MVDTSPLGKQYEETWGTVDDILEDGCEVTEEVGRVYWLDDGRVELLAVDLLLDTGAS